MSRIECKRFVSLPLTTSSFWSQHVNRISFQLVLVLLLAGCNSGDSEKSDVRIQLSFDPSPPSVGNVEVSLDLSDPEGIPLTDAEVRLEGNMNHAGMVPSFADLEEVEPGRYDGTLDFTMGGDWFVLVTAKTPDGKTIQRKIDVKQVKSKE